MSVLDTEGTMNLAEAMATIHDLKIQIAERDNKIAELEEKLSTERVITHNSHFHNGLTCDFQRQILFEELVAWRSFGARMLKSIGGDPDWKRLKQNIYYDGDDPVYTYELKGCSDRDLPARRISVGVKAAIDRAWHYATEAVNAAVKDQREWYEERKRKAEKELDTNPIGR